MNVLRGSQPVVTSFLWARVSEKRPRYGDSHSWRLVGWIFLSAVAVGLSSGPELSMANEEESGPSEVSFSVDVMAVLSRAGCNQGACHGNQNGKGGFQLSLRGESATFDHRAVAELHGGRRIDLVTPEGSLLLEKAIAAVPHQGGQRFDRESSEYRVLREWIASGANFDPDAQLANSLSVHTGHSDSSEEELGPRELLLLEPGAQVDLRIDALFPGNRQREVNQFAVYEMVGSAAEVDGDGRVTGKQIGEATLIVRYLQVQVALAIAVVPPGDSTTNEVDSQIEAANGAQPVAATEPIHHLDSLVDEKLSQLKIVSSELCDDTAFIRRAYLDLLGRLPTADEAREFSFDRQADKRNRLIDRLLATPDYAEYWALKWGDLLRNEERTLDARGVQVFHDWIRAAVADDMPLDQFVSELVAGRGSTYESPPANYYRALRDPMTRAEATARLFLGVRLQCAKCHNHPFERWTQDDYYSWAALFTRVDYEIVENNRRDKYDKHEFNGEQIVQMKEEGEIENPRTGQNAVPRFLGEPSSLDANSGDRLLQLADWLTAPNRRRFAEVQANLIWYHLMGRGIVEPIDDFRITNLPSNPALLDGLTDELIRNEMRPSSLIRLIMQSRTYQASEVPNPTNASDVRNFSHSIPRRLTAEQLLDAQNQVLGTRTSFVNYPDITRAAQLPGARARRPEEGDQFLQKFGKPTRLIGCECERSNETTLDQAFALISGESLQRRLTDPGNQIHQGLRQGADTEELVSELFWRSLSRPPSQAEMSAALALVGESQRSPEAMQDLVWALLNSKEFIYRR